MSGNVCRQPGFVFLRDLLRSSFSADLRVKQNTLADSANHLIPSHLHEKKFGVFPISTSYT